jgi:hypothetical protein
MTIYRFAQAFALLGVLLWLTRVAVDLRRIVLRQNGSVRVPTRVDKWSENPGAKKIMQPATGQKSLRHLFLH